MGTEIVWIENTHEFVSKISSKRQNCETSISLCTMLTITQHHAQSKGSLGKSSNENNCILGSDIDAISFLSFVFGFES